MTEILALIPARGGSKSIPRKNIRPFAGHPLIAWSIAAARAAETVTRIIVSTDDEEIAAVARRYGAEVPFMRPPELAQDDTPDLPVFEHALRVLEEGENYRPEIIVHLRPTSPLRKVWHIDQAVLRLLERPEADSIRSVSPPSQNPFKMYRIGADGLLQALVEVPGMPEAYNMPRQALPAVYWHNGYIDAFWADTVMEQHSVSGRRILPLTLSAEEWIDLDTPEDWARAENLVQRGSITPDDLGFEVQGTGSRD
ncbi:MAG TPA: acylneuraminate cytidylyltransferase family protein [Chloroflexi bacterium]|nr:acylneuraminate cytidylyltransferase family protein [Chloroflexota bacterium]